jgi:hypothetical protein
VRICHVITSIAPPEAASGPAFAYAKPIAYSDVPPRSQVEFCGGRARFFDALQPSEIGEAILQVLVDQPGPNVASAQDAAATCGNSAGRGRQRTICDLRMRPRRWSAGNSTRLSFDPPQTVALGAGAR